MSARRFSPAALAEALLPPLLALAIAALLGDLLILAFGQAPADVYRLLLEGAPARHARAPVTRIMPRLPSSTARAIPRSLRRGGTRARCARRT